MMNGEGRHLDTGSNVLWNFDGMRRLWVGDEGLRGLPRLAIQGPEDSPSRQSRRYDW